MKNVQQGKPMTTQAERIADLETRVAALVDLVDDLRRRVRKAELSREQRRAAKAATICKTPAIDGRCIRPAREAAGWTQSELGAAVGVWQTSVTTWERGRCRVSQKTAREIVRIFKTAGADPPVFEGLEADSEVDSAG